MKKLVVGLICFLAIFWSQPVLAIVSPLASPNNRFGIHIINEGDIEAAANLVNSSGGNWGYVTLVIQDNDLNQEKWQAIFDTLRRYQLIPLVRLATHPEKDFWVKPTPGDVARWADFLSSLNWVVKNRYIILFNEPNHAKEWGGEIKPEEYVAIVKQFTQELKSASSDFFILPAGFDAAAPNSESTMALTTYLNWMYRHDSQVFSYFDGWTSHSYPNPNFSGSPTDTGLGSINSFQAELEILSSFGAFQNLPVFITETGWTHNQGQVLGSKTNSPETVAQFFQTAFTQIWNQPNLVAVTPFVLNYPQAPFENFSWKKPDNGEFYRQYQTVKALAKTSGQPQQDHNGYLVSPDLPSKLANDYHYSFTLKLENTGQSIWEPSITKLKVTGSFPESGLSLSQLQSTEPFSQATVNLVIQTPKEPGEYLLGLQLEANGQVFGDKFETLITVVPRPGFLYTLIHPLATLNLYCPGCF